MDELKCIYSRTKTIQEDKVSGFCPGCMHSTVIKLIGEVLDELDVKSGKISVNDKGAVDCVIQARVETAIKRAGGEN